MEEFTDNEIMSKRLNKAICIINSHRKTIILLYANTLF